MDTITTNHTPAKWFAAQGCWLVSMSSLTDEQVGKLFIAALRYLNSGMCPVFNDALLDYAFAPFKEEVLKSQRAFDAKREGGRKGGRNSGKSRTENQ